jgi:pimeloyl-ACP methyl ester carboxylesterase
MAPAWASAQRRQQVEAQPEGTHRMAYWEWNRTGNPRHPHVIVCVHGLSRQGRDFDVLATELSRFARVICPDVVGAAKATGWPTPWAISCRCMRPICWRCWPSCMLRRRLKPWTGSAPAWAA